ncbi:MAG: protein kinase [Verrucomicrobia bacterium]|nr:protein kinase [Verrucomicrobiota bacterium]
MNTLPPLWGLTETRGSTEESLSSPRRRSFMYNRINSMQEHEEIRWFGLVVEAQGKDAKLRWIGDLPELALSENQISGFFLEIEKLMGTLDYDPAAQKYVFHFVEAKRTIELYGPQNSPLTLHMLLQASYYLFSLYEKPQLSPFLTLMSKALSITEEESLSLFFHYIKKCSGTLPIRPFVRELAHIEARCDWLALFLKYCGGDTLRDTALFPPLAAALEEAGASQELEPHLFTYRVIRRYQQIRQAERLHDILLGSKGELSPSALSFKAMTLAHHIVSTEHRIFSLRNFVVKSTLFSHINLHHNAISGDTYILAKYKTPFVTNPSMMHTSRINLRLPSLLTAKSTSVYIKNSRRCQDLIELRYGAEVHQQLTGHRGIWPLLSSCLYERKSVNKILTITPAADSLHDVIELHSALSFSDTLLIAEDLAYGLEYLHTRKLIHGKIDLESALLSDETCTEKRAGWANFELTRQAQPNLFKNRSYGSRLYTAPELFFLEGTSIDPYKADIWAMGQVLFLLWSHKVPAPWTKAVYDEHVDEAQFITSHKETILDHRNDLLVGYNTAKEEFDLLICSMLSIQAHARPCATQVRERIGEIKQKANFEPINGEAIACTGS